MNNILESFKGKKILILGFGREGKSTLNFLRKWVKDIKIGVADKAVVKIDDSSVTKHFGPDYLKYISNYDIVFKTPGIPGKLPEIKNAKRLGILFTSQTKLFLHACGGQTIGVTGTKGKSTTASLVYHILSEVGMDSVLLGNIGKPCLDYLEADFGKGKYFVFELSSHQLADIDRSPHIAVLLNIFREHLDYYRSFKEYFEAKANITKFQNKNDFFIFNSADRQISDLALSTKAKTLSFLKWNKDFENIIAKKKIPLAGLHNLNNVMAAILVAKVLKIPSLKIGTALENFRPLTHRLETVAIKNGITFVDDTLATIPEATIAAIEAFGDNIGTIILGGSDRGQDFKELAEAILSHKISGVILFPTTGKRIWDEITKVSRGKSLPKHFFVNSMREAVEKSFENTPKGAVCLLSSASPSFSLFKNYEDKSKQFVKAIEDYGPLDR